jgi:hypothetical protein
MRKSPTYSEFFQRNSQRIREMHTRIHETFQHGAKKAWEEACAEFHASYEALAFPGGYESGLTRIAEGDTEAIEAALVFLELRPYFFKSGYMREKLLRRLKHVPFTKTQAQRFSAVVEAQRQWRAEVQHDGLGRMRRNR